MKHAVTTPKRIFRPGGSFWGLPFFCLASALLFGGCFNPISQSVQTISALATSPVISIKADSTLTNGQSLSLGTLSINGTKDTTLTISNNGKTALNISSYNISVTSGSSSLFSISQAPATSVAAGGSTSLIVHFAGTEVGSKAATLSINSNDVSNPSYTIKFTASVTTAPTGFAIDRGNGCVSLSWNAVTGASSYTVYYSTTAGVTKTNGVAITGITATSYSQTGLQNGTTYYYIVTATIGGVEYDPTSQLSATPTNVTGPPQNPAITKLSPTVVGKGNTVLTWEAPATLTASSYDVYQATDSSISKTVYKNRYTGIGSSTYTYTDAAATPGVTNYYLVTSVNSAGESLNSTVVSLLVQPDPPSSFSATGGSDQASLSWTASTGATSYNIYRSTSSGFTPGTGNFVASASGTSYTDTGLAGNTTYYYDIIAVNSTGSSLAYCAAYGKTVSTLSLSNDATLASLTGTVGGSSGTLSPTFSSGTTSYTLSLPWNSGTSLAVSGVANQGNATVSNPSAVTLTNSGSVTTPISVTVTAQDGSTTKTYTITTVYQKSYAFVVNHGGNSVYSYSQDPTTGLLTQVGTMTTGSSTSPVTVAVTPNNSYLYTANNGGCSISAFSINTNGSLTSLSTPSYSTGSYAPWDLKISPNGKFLFTYESYGSGGYVSSWLINSDGSLTSETAHLATQMANPTCPCQMAVSPDSAHVYTIPYANSPYMTRFDVSSSTGALTTGSTSTTYQTAWGNSMLSLAIHPTGLALYVTKGTGSSWSYIYNATVDTSTGIASGLTNGFDTSTTWPVKAIVDPQGRCLFFFRTSGLYYSRINQTAGTYLTEQTYSGTSISGDDNDHNRPCFDPTNSYLYTVHESENYIEVHPVSWSYSAPYYSPTFGTYTTVSTGSGTNPWQMAVVRQPGY